MTDPPNNQSIGTDAQIHPWVTYYPLFVIIAGTLFNLFTLLILCRPVFRDTSKRPTIHYMRVIAVFDILILYGWNFDHYLQGAHGFRLQAYVIVSCKIVSFLNYFAAQVSAWVRVFICLDRYLSLSRLHKTWFGQSKSVLIIIASIVSIFFVLNVHILLFACYTKADGSIDTNSHLYAVYPMWDFINLGVYNTVPFMLMSMFNSGVIYHLIHLRQTSTVQNSRIHHRSISVTLVITTCLFLLMTTPATISFAFFIDTTSYTVLHLLDCILYTYHILSFPLYLLTFTEFRHESLRLLKLRPPRRVEPAVSQCTLPPRSA